MKLGHYYAFALHTDVDGNSSWWLYNDTLRRLATDEEVTAFHEGGTTKWNKADQAYMVFYEKASFATAPSSSCSVDSKNIAAAAMHPGDSRAAAHARAKGDNDCERVVKRTEDTPGKEIEQLKSSSAYGGTTSEGAPMIEGEPGASAPPTLPPLSAALEKDKPAKTSEHEVLEMSSGGKAAAEAWPST